MKLRVRAYGMAFGVLLGLAYCLGTIYSIAFGAGLTYQYYANFLPFLQRSFLGVIIGLVGGFIEGFLIGAFFAWLYNKFHGMIYGSKEAAQG